MTWLLAGLGSVHFLAAGQKPAFYSSRESHSGGLAGQRFESAPELPGGRSPLNPIAATGPVLSLLVSTRKVTVGEGCSVVALDSTRLSGAILGRASHHTVLHLSAAWGGLEKRNCLFGKLLQYEIPTSPKLGFQPLSGG